MPELPEVETIRRHLAPLVEGRRLSALEVVDPRWCAPLAAADLSAAVEGRLIERLSRRGKYLVVELEDDVHLLMHLRMTGTLLYDPDSSQRYVRVVARLDDGHELRFCDPRRFGTGELAIGAGACESFLAARVGLEPLDGDLDGAALRALARGRRGPVKPFLLDQRRIAGIGNIYADEALFRAGVHPLRPAGSLSRAQCDALAAAVVAALRAGLDAGGATIDDFRHPDGAHGAFQNEFLVHRRAGEPCPRCGTEIVKTVVGGRGTYLCERCQRPPRGARVRRPGPRAPRAGRSGRP
ncbi:MAG: bifunctional DNA-formamidopyrimidine glycosylase/DNA-(apurinic or apyrimidinic site) lyase [Solirubrobacteraceae bacterium]|nr:bifunctional DNA-formamidopyrimidine glycosylase/DNA-(apurinic or apyrimidinic site) lyase [Solirubrobacteraceae bacterium]